MERAELARLLGAKGATRSGRQVVTEIEPRRFMMALAEAVAGDGEIFLGDPVWGQNERQQLSRLLKSESEHQNTKTAQGWLMIPTGGSAGGLKFARHDEHTLAAAVEGFTRHFRLNQVNAVGVLPLWHVSGLMAWMRCALTGGDFLPLDWQAVERGTRSALPAKADGWSISLVPTQLERLLRDPAAVEWLRGFRMVFVGGAACPAELLDRAAAARLPVALSYGMTETAAMVAAQREGDFARGDRTCGRAMPHATINVREDGIVRVKGPSVFHGYHPENRTGDFYATADEGALDAQERLTISRRRDWVIISGGEKVDPAEVEAVLRSTGQFADVAVIGVPDAEWGQKVVAIYPMGGTPDLAKVGQVIASRLSDFKRPKAYVPAPEWPRTAAGKLNRAALVALTRGKL